MTDLHLHLDGSLPIKTIIKLARLQNITLPSEDEKTLKKYLTVSPSAQSLNDYLKCFDLPLELLQSCGAVELSVYELICELTRQGIIYSEIRFAPQLHTRRGCTQRKIIEAAIKGLEKAERDFNTKSNLILCAMRGGSDEDNLLTVRLAAEYLNCGVCALDLAGAEALYKTELYSGVFALAKQLDIPFTIHAGEADGAQSVKAAVDFGARRIGHGVAAVNDVELMYEVKRKNITIECCTTSNLQTRAVASLSQHPIKEFFRLGINVTVNTDNMTVSDTTIDKELSILSEIIPDISRETLMRNAINAAFLSEKEKAELLEKISNK
ncbi:MULTISPECIES: adenosine deaminase [unclassified Ruminococcus]|uniref:adenosine deaminase n=1 Tax=unclassified Ruminococcus TaxID=2608920 RepID=UPI00210BE0D7|nr:MULTISPECIES: adenosine deaminase [unclassified Ruminococcus]MCQ4022457.1 adenosine deaminase [Ruminococcus sp. zg-924]MCQ4115721.1 adenosine deaminase [Ruminococcus sp. zg-921]